MYDVVIIGSGPGGYTSAISAAKLGFKTAIIEADAMGGTCLNTGCIPTKYFITQMHYYEETQKNIANQLFCGKITLNFLNMKKALAEKITSLSDSIKMLIKNSGVEIIKGHAEFIDKTHVRINENGRIIEAAYFIIATGSSPKIMDVDSANCEKLKHCFTTDNIFYELNSIPRTITIVGAGAVGLELAFIFAGFGSQVTVVERRATIFSHIDEDIDVELKKMIKKKEINLILNANIDSILETKDGIAIFDEDEEQIVKSEIIIFAFGRTPNISALKLENADISIKDGHILVDEKMRTSCPNIFAVGDVNAVKPFAHAAMVQAENVIAFLAGSDDFKELDIIPICIFTDIEIAYTGLTPNEAQKKNISVRTVKFPMTANGRSKVEDNWGYIKIIVDQSTDTILGGVCVSHIASELISYINIAIRNKMTASQFSSIIFPHPTYSESLSEAASIISNKCIHIL